ncbi:MAG: hypothetical protein WD077_15795 [Bacteroidia bacterium]
MATDLPKEVYEQKLLSATSSLGKVKNQLNTIVVARLMVFIIAIILIALTFRISILISTSIFIVASIAFIFLVKKHLKLKEQEADLKLRLRINKEEIAYLEGDLTAFAAGEEFSSHEHSYSLDLDIFGEGSLFQSINRTGTMRGKELLAWWLANPLQEIDEIKLRQEAVQELAAKTDWRQSFRVRTLRENEKPDWQKELLHWVNHPVQVVDNVFLKTALFAIPVLTFILMGLMLAGYVSFFVFLAYFILVPFGITGFRVKRINRIHSTLSGKVNLLQQYGHLLFLIEGEHWKSALATKEQEQLREAGRTAGEHIRQLARLASSLDNRLNMIAALVLNGFLLWDLHYVRAIRKWQEAHGGHVEHWISAIATFDALSSLATFAFNHPRFALPELAATDDFLMETLELGHPLLHEKERVDNNISFGKNERLYLVTGANMAGKSTFLRTVGVNLVLAMNGTPVCARSFRFAPIRLFTGMRTRDSLQKHESYFFAELKRLQQLIRQLRTGARLFIILDEILKGTNSQDQHQGSEALIRQLVKLDAYGLIATHDLALGSLAAEFPHLANKRFEVEIQNDKLNFDYKLKDGISQNLNATFLMRQMGISDLSEQ